MNDGGKRQNDSDCESYFQAVKIQPAIHRSSTSFATHLTTFFTTKIARARLAYRTFPNKTAGLRG